MVFQSYALFPHLSVAENILFGLRVRKVPSGERAQRLQRVADLLGLTALLARKPSQLSGGQQQRVALGRAIIAQTPVCLMDEPLSNLDAQLRAEMRLEIRALQRKLGITMVYVTHDQIEAMSMADRVVLMRAGRIEQNGNAGRALRGSRQHVRRALHRHAADEPAAARSGRRRCRDRGYRRAGRLRWRAVRRHARRAARAFAARVRGGRARRRRRRRIPGRRFAGQLPRRRPADCRSRAGQRRAGARRRDVDPLVARRAALFRCRWSARIRGTRGQPATLLA